MPKATKTKTTTRAHAPSAKKRTQAGSPAADTDPSQWRESTIPFGQTIQKSEAKENYRLKPEHFEGLPFHRKVNKGGYKQDTFTYQERDVERRAWELHGGPEGYDAYLAKLYERHAKRYGKKRFIQPDHYTFGRKVANKPVEEEAEEDSEGDQ